MQAFALISLVFGLLFSASFASPILSSRSISSSLYDDLVRYTKYSSASYQLLCPSPLGNTLVKSFSAGDTQGFIARDDDRNEIVVSFRGSFSLADAATDVDLFLVPFVSPGITKSFNVHSGFLAAYNDVANIVLTTVEAQVAKFPNLGGALAALGAVSLRTALPSAPMKLYTFGQPRTGDAQFAKFVETSIGINNIFQDGVPTLVPRVLGYQHQCDPIPILTSAPTTVTKCAGEEDRSCSDSILSTGINAAHIFYFGQIMAVNPLLCI
ncbi:Alpha/Beta hydrolase protein [Mycena capillaripes]|nr:Alpha/Beta hydrolase protein [Mycena capillaripes]